MIIMDEINIYYWAHSEFDELNTPVFKDLIRKADVIFREHVDDDLDITSEIQKDVNQYSQKGVASEKFERIILNAADDFTNTLFLLRYTKI